LELGDETHQIGYLVLCLGDPVRHQMAHPGLHRAALIISEQVEEFGNLVQSQAQSFGPGDEPE
jgi:hypothetical protein